ncbi:four helix bundle protein [Mariniflexile sp. HMF6888]
MKQYKMHDYSFEKFGLISQMRQCSVSIPPNIVEGTAK